MTLHIVLTGGIASGKSAVSQFFEELGIKVIDADIFSRSVVAKGSAGLKAISEHFGSSVLLEDGTLDRSALREIVFSNQSARQWLNQLLHPLIRAEMSGARKASEQAKELYTINVIPLYYETIHGTEEENNYHRVIVVDTPEEKQLERLMSRDNSSKEQARAILASQTGREERLSIANDVIQNNSDLQSLKQQVIKLDSVYRELARN
ncbi:dephospho-CoA kinase [Kangiella sediminilitoris]|uniref:Dephospho-CoA kinase n=1 Tax=Kangiella sediminilitoris TaxID=1144748 RepID=A0A1B3BCC8_9GAMM|nr:dephospho-CoA kinase [Kangiella sediminilitoris]AOE50448.1 Dephospho-CoA kinase [Kangiella sediminilitoris]